MSGARTYDIGETIYCEGCRSWAVPEEGIAITPQKLVAEWGWTEEWDEGTPLYFCPECS